MAKGFGSRLIELRTERGINQSRLADLLGVSSTAVWNWEQQGVVPRPALLSKLAKTLGVTPAYLLTGANAASPKRTAADIVKAAAEEIAALNGVHVSRVRIDWSINNEHAPGARK